MTVARLPSRRYHYTYHGENPHRAPERRLRLALYAGIHLRWALGELETPTVVAYFDEIPGICRFPACPHPRGVLQRRDRVAMRSAHPLCSGHAKQLLRRAALLPLDGKQRWFRFNRSKECPTCGRASSRQKGKKTYVCPKGHIMVPSSTATRSAGGAHSP